MTLPKVSAKNDHPESTRQVVLEPTALLAAQFRSQKAGWYGASHLNTTTICESSTNNELFNSE
jgi:hypothetical protein